MYEAVETKKDHDADSDKVSTAYTNRSTSKIDAGDEILFI